MTRDDIIRMAREVDLHERVKDGVGYVVRIPNLEKLERFAALVAAVEREACARIADKCIEDSQKVTPESEQEENYLTAMRILSEEFAIAIRARGEA